MMKTSNETNISNALKEVWEWKQKAYDRTKDLTTDELLAHYKINSEQLAKYLNTKIIENEGGGFRFE